MSIDFIPISVYVPLYYQVLLVVTLITFSHIEANPINSKNNLAYIKITGFFLFWFVLLYIGLRPIHGVFVDMVTYSKAFMDYQGGWREITLENKDILHQIFTKLSSKIMSVQSYFLLCATLYVVPLYVISKKWFKQYWFYAFLMLISSFEFWGYGVNGIRNGIATSLFLLAISRDKKIFQIIWILIAIGFHKTLMLPALGFVITWFCNAPKVFIYFWLISIPLSLALPGFWENLFANMIEDDRATAYLSGKIMSESVKAGFRWDFLIYGATGVLAGLYYIFKEKYTNKIYVQLFNTYLFANAFWILVIRAGFSNRFAYLSWFMLALVIVYPWLKDASWHKQHKRIGLIILGYFAFTYFMRIVI